MILHCENNNPCFIAPITSEDRIVYVPLGGKPIKCLMVDDAVMFLDEPEGLIPDIREHVPNIRNMDMNHDDVIICAFPKSGTCARRV
jgi:hypothetical protein